MNSDQIDKLLIYLVLLLKWNSKINLIGQASEEETITRHFGESLYIARFEDLPGRLLDIGSGAGFPGLALKIVNTELEITLLEPITKKRAFLKEVTRQCRFDHVTVLGDRLEDFSKGLADPKFDLATSRAVGGFPSLIENAARCLKPGGRLCLWVGNADAASISASCPQFRWGNPRPIPMSRNRGILIGELEITSPKPQCFT